MVGCLTLQRPSLSARSGWKTATSGWPPCFRVRVGQQIRQDKRPHDAGPGFRSRVQVIIAEEDQALHGPHVVRFLDRQHFRDRPRIDAWHLSGTGIRGPSTAPSTPRGPAPRRLSVRSASTTTERSVQGPGDGNRAEPGTPTGAPPRRSAVAACPFSSPRLERQVGELPHPVGDGGLDGETFHAAGPVEADDPCV